jgi:hypothetical protein
MKAMVGRVDVLDALFRAAGLALSVLLLAGNCSAGRAEQPGPLWVQDLGANPFFAARKGHLCCIRPPRLDFLDETHLVVAFDDDVFSYGGPNAPFQFHVLEISAQSGMAGRHRAFPVTLGTSEVRAIASTGKYEGYGLPVIGHFTRVHSEVRVFDWRRMRQVFTVSLNKPVAAESHGFKQMAVALSPDGTRLAILDDFSLSLYRVP